MSSKIYSYSYSNINGKVKEEEIRIEDGKGKITKKEDGDIIEDEDITMEELEDYMKEKNIDLYITPELLEDAVDMLNQLLKSKNGRKNLEQLQKLDLLEINDGEDDIDEETSLEEINPEEDDDIDQESALEEIDLQEDDEITGEEITPEEDDDIDQESALEEIDLEEDDESTGEEIIPEQVSNTISEEEAQHCEKILKLFGIEGTKPTKDEFLKVYNKLYNAYLEDCKGLRSEETTECKAKLAELDKNFEAYSDPYNCWDN